MANGEYTRGNQQKQKTKRQVTTHQLATWRTHCNFTETVSKHLNFSEDHWSDASRQLTAIHEASKS